MILSYEEAAALMTPPADPNDPLFRLTVEAAHQTIENYCDRYFDRGTFTEVVRPTTGNRLRVSHAPLGSVTAMWIDPYGLFGVGTEVADLSRLVVDSNSNLIITTDQWLWGVDRSVRVTYEAGYWPADDPDPLHVPKMPADLRRACAKMIALASAEGFEKQAVSESLGAYSVSFQSQSIVPTNWSDIDPSITPTLDRYRRWYL